MIPAPKPITALSTISSRRLVESIEPMPESRKIVHPNTKSFTLFPRCDHRPASNIAGMISNEGSDSSISISRVLAFGNMLSKSLRIGDIAKPGSDTTAEIESMATRATREMVPFPVEIFIVERFSRHCAIDVPQKRGCPPL